jgi:hypothetical protein
VYISEQVLFVAVYRMQGKWTSPPTATMTLSQHGKVFFRYHMDRSVRSDGKPFFSVTWEFDRDSRVGPAVATFTIKAGPSIITRTLKFSFQSGA